MTCLRVVDIVCGFFPDRKCGNHTDIELIYKCKSYNVKNKKAVQNLNGFLIKIVCFILLAFYLLELNTQQINPYRSLGFQENYERLIALNGNFHRKISA